LVGFGKISFSLVSMIRCQNHLLVRPMAFASSSRPQLSFFTPASTSTSEVAGNFESHLFVVY
jgi:hypothetical protein